MKKQIIVLAAAFLYSGAVVAQKIDINKMPTPGATPTINIAKPQSFQLKNGLTVMVVENHKLPKVSINLSMDHPPYSEGQIAGVSDMMADQLGNGSTKMSKENFNKKIDFLGASLSFSANGAYSNTLSKYFPEVLSLMSDAIINPVFTDEELQTSKDRAIEGLKSEEKSAAAISGKVYDALVYGKNTSRGEFETEASIKNIKLSDVKNVYNNYYAPNNAYLVIVGDVQFNDVKNQIEKAFGGWKSSSTKFAALEPAKNVDKTEIDVVDVPSAVQSVISAGNITTLKMKDPNYFPAIIASYILGGGSEARLFMNLREKNAFTYGAYSSMSASKYAPFFNANTSVRNEVTDKAVKELMNELKGITTIKPEELANAKAKLKGSFIMSLEKPETIARFALNQKLQDLPSDFYTNYLKNIDKITINDVVGAAKSTILPNQTRIFIVGKASEISENLEKLGYPVKYFDKDANPAKKPEIKKVDANVTVASVIDKYINAIGGKENLSKISSYTTNGTISIQGQTINVKRIRANGGKDLTLISSGGNVMQKEMFDGTKGYTQAMGQKVDMTPEKITEKRKNLELFEELGFVKTGEYTLAGIEKINGEDSYVVKSKDEKNYYSVATGLKTGNSKTVKAQGQEITVPTTFSDYKEVNGVKFPFTITINQMGMELPIKVSSYDINKATDEDFK